MVMVKRTSSLLQVLKAYGAIVGNAQEVLLKEQESHQTRGAVVFGACSLVACAVPLQVLEDGPQVAVEGARVHHRRPLFHGKSEQLQRLCI